MLEFNKPINTRKIAPENIFLTALPNNYEVSDRSNLIQFRSKTQTIDAIKFYPQDWVFSFDIAGELQGKVYAKFLINEKNRSILNNPFQKQSLTDSIHQFLTSFFNSIEEKYNYMAEILECQELGMNVIPPASLQLENKEWIKFTSRYIYMSTDYNIPVDLCFQFIKKGSGHV